MDILCSPIFSFPMPLEQPSNPKIPFLITLNLFYRDGYLAPQNPIYLVLLGCGRNLISFCLIFTPYPVPHAPLFSEVLLHAILPIGLVKWLIEQLFHSPSGRYHIEIKCSVYFGLVNNKLYCLSNTRMHGSEKQDVVDRIMVPNY